MLERRVGPFFIMVSEMIARDFSRFIVIPLTILPAFAITFNVIFKFAAIDGGDLPSGLPASADLDETALEAHANFGKSAFTLVLMGVGLGDQSMFGSFGRDADFRVMLLLLLYILLVPILSLNLLVAMMAGAKHSDSDFKRSVFI